MSISTILKIVVLMFAIAIFLTNAAFTIDSAISGKVDMFVIFGLILSLFLIYFVGKDFIKI
jgi:hypothetical protein